MNKQMETIRPVTRSLVRKRPQRQLMEKPERQRAPQRGDAPPSPEGPNGLDYLLILVGLPLLLLLAAAVGGWVKLVSRGRVIFRQTRVGYRGRPFTINKFRTMVEGSDPSDHEDHVLKLLRSDRPMTKLDSIGDERLILGGKFLRLTGLDELPQVINVLRGEMRLVGPRPCLPREYEFYDPRQCERFTVLPGLTGYWQVHGKNAMTFKEMIALDVHYVRNWSPWLDLVLIFQTPGAILSHAVESRRRREEDLEERSDSAAQIHR